jgi:hypothetical protein
VGLASSYCVYAIHEVHMLFSNIRRDDWSAVPVNPRLVFLFGLALKFSATPNLQQASNAPGVCSSTQRCKTPSFSSPSTAPTLETCQLNSPLAGRLGLQIASSPRQIWKDRLEHFRAKNCQLNYWRTVHTITLCRPPRPGSLVPERCFS